jgi:uncharacterized membrane protein YbhN (UPF0104 family)
VNAAAKEAPAPSHRGSGKNVLRVVLGTLVGGALLYVVFRDTDWSTVGHAVANMSLPWFFAAQVVGWASYFTRAQRWRSIVNASCRVPYRPVWSATQVGQLFNLTPIPRIGELVRVFVLSRLTPVSFSRSFSTATLDRVTDFLALLALILLSLLAFPTHQDITVPGEYLGVQGDLTIPLLAVRTGAVMLGSMVGVGLIGLIVLYARRRWLVGLLHQIVHPFSPSLAQVACRFFDEFGEGLHVFRSARDLAATLFWAAVTWVLMVLTVEFVLLAFHLPHPWYASSLMTALVATLLMVNVAPGFVGQFHLAIIAAIVLTSPETSPAEAKAVAIVAHLCALYPTIILGVWALSREHLRLGELLRILQRKPVADQSSDGEA